MKRTLLITSTSIAILFTTYVNSKSYAQENTSINIESTTTGYINADTVNFRNEANLQSNIYYTLDKNEELQIISNNGDWSKVIHNDKSGYVYSKYISTDKEVLSIDDYDTMTVKATAYAGDTITSTGTTPKWGTIAVDPTVIPYGTKVYIPEFDMVFIAEDTGSAIKGNRIDIFMDTEDHCNEWGVRDIDIYIMS